MPKKKPGRVGRPPEGNGPREVVLSVRLTEADMAKLVDAARGEWVSAWARDVLLRAARRAKP